jgi:hypothetical protein
VHIDDRNYFLRFGGNHVIFVLVQVPVNIFSLKYPDLTLACYFNFPICSSFLLSSFNSSLLLHFHGQSSAQQRKQDNSHSPSVGTPAQFGRK